jgi:uncharacterized OsmC-like protein
MDSGLGASRQSGMTIDKCPVHRTLTSEIDIRTSEDSNQTLAR